MKNLKIKIMLALAISVLSAFGVVICAAAQDKVETKSPANVILVGWDGAQRDHLMELLSSGRLPNLQKLISEGSMALTEVTKSATQTKPGWAEILTGYSAKRLRIRNNRYYEPIPAGYTVFERLGKFFGRRNITTVFLTGKINNLGARGPHEICMNCISRGSTHAKTNWWDKKSITTSQTEDGKPPVWARRQGEPYFNTIKSVDSYASELGSAKNVGEQALAALDRYQKEPFFAFFHFEEPDEQGHLYNENSKEYGEAIITADQWLGEIVKKLSALGIYEKTTVYVATDHGMDEGGFEHHNAPQTLLAVNNGIKLKNGDRKDVTPTILEEYGIDLKSITPALDGKSLLSK